MIRRPATPKERLAMPLLSSASSVGVQTSHEPKRHGQDQDAGDPMSWATVRFIHGDGQPSASRPRQRRAYAPGWPTQGAGLRRAAPQSCARRGAQWCSDMILHRCRPRSHLRNPMCIMEMCSEHAPHALPATAEMLTLMLTPRWTNDRFSATLHEQVWPLP